MHTVGIQGFGMKKNMIALTLKGTSIPHEITGVYGAGRVLLRSALPTRPP